MNLFERDINFIDRNPNLIYNGGFLGVIIQVTGEWIRVNGIIPKTYDVVCISGITYDILVSNNLVKIYGLPEGRIKRGDLLVFGTKMKKHYE